MLQFLLHLQFQFICRFFLENRLAKILTVLGLVSALGVLVGLVYESFYYGFIYIARDEYFKEALTIYIVELFFLVSFILIYASALMSGLFSMFRSEKDSVILASPRYDLKITFVFVRMFFSSFWPLFVIILPALLAFHNVSVLSIVGLLLALLSSVLLIGVASMFAIVTLLLVGEILDTITTFSFRKLLSAIVALFVAMLFVVWGRFHSLDLVSFFQARILNQDLPDLTPILVQFKVFPSHHAALTVFYSYLGEYTHALFSVLYTGLAFTLFLLCYLFLKKEYLGLWQRGQEGVRENSIPYMAMSLLKATTPVTAMLAREVIVFVRNARGVMWVGFIMLIWLFQAASSRILSHGLSGERVANTDISSIVSSLQVSVIMYFVAMFVLRFAFPSFSAEQKSVWIIHSSPVNMDQVYAVKLLFFTGLFTVIALCFTIGNALSLGLLLPLSAPLLLVVLLGTFSLTTFGLSLGVLFPNTETDDPERLSTTLPGIGFIFGSLCYGVFSAIALHRYLFSADLLSFTIFIVCSLLTSLFFVSRVHHSFLPYENHAR